MHEGPPAHEHGAETSSHRGQDRRAWFTGDDDQEADARGRPNRDTTTQAHPSAGTRQQGRYTRRVKE